MVRKGFGQRTSQGCNNGEGESRGILENQKMKIVDESILFFSGVSLSKFSLEALYNMWI